LGPLEFFKMLINFFLNLFCACVPSDLLLSGDSQSIEIEKK
jgi:hypothetical protein